MISKTGYTKQCKHLIKILRKNRKPVKRGGAFFSSFLNSNTNNINSNNKQNEEDGEELNQHISVEYKNFEKVKDISAAVVAAEILVHGSAPLLIGSGVGIPLLAIMFMTKQLIVQYRQYVELNILFNDVLMIIMNCYYLESLIKETIQLFSPYVSIALKQELENTNNTELINELTDVQMNALAENQTSQNETLQTPTMTIGGSDKIQPNSANKIQQQIIEKLDILKILLQKIDGKTKNTNKFSLDSLKERADRFFFSKNHKNNILDSLTVINAYFTIYNSQFDWSIRYYERLILKKYKNNKIDGKSGDEILEEIWTKIEGSQEFKDYIFQNEETINKTLQNPEVKQEVNKDIQDTVQIPTNEDGIPLSQISTENRIGGRIKYLKTKNKKRTKHTLKKKNKKRNNTKKYKL